MIICGKKHHTFKNTSVQLCDISSSQRDKKVHARHVKTRNHLELGTAQLQQFFLAVILHKLAIFRAINSLPRNIYDASSLIQSQ